MTRTLTTIPKIGEALNYLVTSMGLRQQAESLQGGASPLDILANERKNADLCKNERTVMTEMLQKPLLTHCGGAWAESFMTVVNVLLSKLRTMAQEFDVGFLPPDQGRAIVLDQFLLPMAASALEKLHAIHGGPDLADFVAHPFRTWCEWTESVLLLPKEPEDGRELRNTLCSYFGVIDNKTFANWKIGHPIGKLLFHNSKGAKLTFDGAPQGIVHNVTAWLIIARLLQAFPAKSQSVSAWISRGTLSYSDAGDGLIRALETAIENRFLSDVRFEKWGAASQRLETAFLEWRQARLRGDHDSSALKNALSEAEQVRHDCVPALTCANCVIVPWVRAWLEWNRGESEKAMDYFRECVDTLWWCGGPHSGRALQEAITFAAGIGDKPEVTTLWLKASFLGLHHPLHQELKDKDFRDLALPFKDIFGKPVTARSVKHKAMELLPIHTPGVDMQRVTPDEVDGKGKPTPRYWKYGRMTPLMAHIIWGSAESVRKLLEAGHSVDEVVKETGMTALHCALWKVRWTGDEEMLNLVLERRPKAETVNQKYGEWGEKPLWTAIGTCRPNIVQRLLTLFEPEKLKAAINAPCDNYNRPLYATLLHWHMRTAKGQAVAKRKRLSGQWPAGNAMMKLFGYAFDSSALERIREMERDPRKREICDQTASQMFPPLDEEAKNGLREIARLLLEIGAKPNTEVDTNVVTERFAPTLYAAEIGDLELFKLLVEKGGNPSLSVDSESGLARKDALFLATAYGHTGIVNYLHSRTTP